MSNIDAATLARALGKAHAPTAEQAKVIEGPLAPKLVVAGAGAGKTETMAARVVYLVANGLVKPEQVLGMTFTRKAAQQLEQRIRSQLLALKNSGIIAPGSEVAHNLDNISVKVATYDSFAGDLIREFGLLVPVEPNSRIITEAEHYAIAHEVVSTWDKELKADSQPETVVSTLIKLSESLDSKLTDIAAVAEHEQIFRKELADLQKTTKNGPEYSAEVEKWLHIQRLRLQYFPLVSALAERKRELGVTTFGAQMAAAAEAARTHPTIGEALRARFRVVLLDEYQDTSHAQRVLLRGLFGGQHYPGLSVIAVGDPMQAIYGWRGATIENLAAFVKDFPQADGSPAEKDQLTTSWRNPSRVLDLANDVASEVFGSGPRPVDPLSGRPQAQPGEIKLGYFATQQEEVDFVTAHLAQKYQEFLQAGQLAQQDPQAPQPRPFSAAVLVRNNSQSLAFAQALTAAGVPNEIAGLGGLLQEPEVQDLLALATMVVRPQDSAAALRVLSGPLVGLGLDDLTALRSRARNLAGGMREDNSGARVVWSAGKDPAEHLRQQLEAIVAQSPEQVPGLADAVADLAEKSRYSAQGLARIQDLAAKLRHIRTYSMGKSLTDFFADLDAEFSVRTEVLALGKPGGSAQLDKFASVVADYPGHSIEGFLDYCALALEHAGGLDLGEVPAEKNCVQIMTVHKSKGLEFGHVCVVHADTATYKAKAETFLTTITQVPGDDDVIDTSEAVKRSDFAKAAKAYKEQYRDNEAEELSRLFYVAMTRTEHTLTVTGSGTNRAKGRAKKQPYGHLERLAQRYPDLVAHWEVPQEPVEEELEAEAEAATFFPYVSPRPEAVEAAALVAQAMDQDVPLQAGELYSTWEKEATALIEEWKSLSQPVVNVVMPDELTATDLVALRHNPTAFARRQRRPVPFKPNSYAKRGTAFHAWLEERFGAAALWTHEELPGTGESEEYILENLKHSFENSQWAQRTPYEVEAPFEITVGKAVVRGRMDAVFQEPDGSWLIVDWKTGRRPQGEDMRAAEIQLAVYAAAWRRLSGSDAPVRAAFHYVAEDYTFIPQSMPDEKQLAQLLDDSAAPQF